MEDLLHKADFTLQILMDLKTVVIKYLSIFFINVTNNNVRKSGTYQTCHRQNQLNISHLVDRAECS